MINTLVLENHNKLSRIWPAVSSPVDPGTPALEGCGVHNATAQFRKGSSIVTTTALQYVHIEGFQTSQLSCPCSATKLVSSPDPALF